MACSAIRKLVASSNCVAASRTYANIDKIVCLGKQYNEHAKELGEPQPANPVIFNKFGSIAQKVQAGKILDVSDILPKDKGPVHFEAEICIQLGVAGSIAAVSLGLDLTLRDLQKQLKQDGHPWEIGKCFPGSAIIGPWIAIEEFQEYLKVPFELFMDDSLKQTACGFEMRLQPEEAIQYIENFFPLVEGDVIFTGTPSGVGEIEPGQIGTLKWGDKLEYQVQF